jgi:hypothetical protein
MCLERCPPEAEPEKSAGVNSEPRPLGSFGANEKALLDDSGTSGNGPISVPCVLLSMNPESRATSRPLTAVCVSSAALPEFLRPNLGLRLVRESKGWSRWAKSFTREVR